MSDRRIEGIEWLRAAMSICVVAWHLAGGGRSLIFSDRFVEHSFTLSDLVNFHILLLAVPTFVLISNYLLARCNPDAATALHRVRRVGLLLLFWPFMMMLFRGGWDGFVADVPSTVNDALVYILSAGDTVYYFFVSLLITNGLTILSNRLSLSINVALFAASVVGVGVVPFVSIAYDWPMLSAFWSPINFIPYSFAAIVVWRFVGKDSPPIRAVNAAAVLVFIGCVSAALEWRFYANAVFFPGQYFNFPAYTRPSIILFSVAIFVAALRVRRRVPRVVGAMAKYSLALYCLHMFLVTPMRALLQRSVGGLPELGEAWLLIGLTVVSSYLAAKALSRVLNERLLF